MRLFDNAELKRRIDEVLFYIWDPIGVHGEPYARDEYKSYVPGVLKLVEGNRSKRKISDHLAGIVRVDMGISPSKDRCDYTAEILLGHKKAIEEGCA